MYKYDDLSLFHDCATFCDEKSSEIRRVYYSREQRAIIQPTRTNNRVISAGFAPFAPFIRHDDDDTAAMVTIFAGPPDLRQMFAG